MRPIVTTFLRGLGVVVPAVFTLWLLVWLAMTTERLLREVFLFVLPERLYMPGMGFVLGIGIVFAVGVLLQVFVIQQFWDWFERVLERIPLVKTIYNSARDLFGFVSSSAATDASSVVLIDVGGGMRLVGFVTDGSSTALSKLGTDLIAVYLPLSYQIGGYTVLIPRDRVSAVDWTMEEAMRFVLTAGIQRKPNA